MLRNVIFIVESVENLDIFQSFSIFLNLENYESVKVGEFFKSDLPKGLNFPVLLNKSWFDKPEFEVEIHKNHQIFAGIFEFQAEKNFPAQSKLTLSGIATLYNVKDHMENVEIHCTIVVEEVERRESVRTSETQTVMRIQREEGVQTDAVPPPPPKTDASTNTTGRHINLEDLEPILTASIARHLQQHHDELQNKNASVAVAAVVDEDVPDPKPSEKSIMSAGNLSAAQVESRDQNNTLNSFNLYPRIAKLRDLDVLIAEKQRILEELELEIELKRKILVVKAKRAENEKIVKSPQKLEPKLSEDPKNEKISEESTEKSPKSAKSSRSTSSESTSTSETSESSESDSSSESSSSEDSESTTTSSDSNSTVKNEKNGKTDEKLEELAENPAKDDEESVIEDPFSPRKSPESPTSAYLSNMRNRILEQYSQKYN